MSDAARLLRCLRGYPLVLLAVLLATLGFAAFSGLSLGMILPFSHLIFGSAEPGAPADGAAIAPHAAVPEGAAPDPLLPGRVVSMQQRARERIIDALDAGTPRATLERVCLVMLLLFTLKAVFASLQAVTIAWLENAVSRDLREAMFSHYLRLPLASFRHRRSGEIVSRLVNDAWLVRQAVNAILGTIARDGVLVLTYGAVLFWIHWPLALAASVVLPPIALIASWVGRRLRRQAAAAQESIADFASNAQEAMAGVRVVKAFGMEDHEADRFRRHNVAFFRVMVRLQGAGAVTGPAAELAAVAGAIAVLWWGGRSVLGGASVHAEWFLVFIVAILSMARPLKNIASVNQALQEGLAAARRVFGEIDTPAEVLAAPGARPVAAIERDIVFDAVDFAYPGGPPVLRGIRFRAPRGGIVALVGPSGAGKSTLVDLLPRFHEPTAGRILLDGVDLRAFRLDALRAMIGTVPQDTVLFHDTVFANIAYGARGATREAVESAARAANAHGFIASLRAGYDTVVGERGVMLSGGERQRIAIARAVLRNPPILILDEATSSLDSESEVLVQEAIDRLLADRTTFVIAHRLSTVQHARLILVLDRGRIVEAGRHDALLARDGLYRRLHDMQFTRRRTPDPQAAGA